MPLDAVDLHKATAGVVQPSWRARRHAQALHARRVCNDMCLANQVQLSTRTRQVVTQGRLLHGQRHTIPGHPV